MENWERDRKCVTLARVCIRLLKATDRFLGEFSLLLIILLCVNTEERDGCKGRLGWAPGPKKWAKMGLFAAGASQPSPALQTWLGSSSAFFLQAY